MLTKEQAVALRYGQELHHVSKKDSRGAPMRIRVSGKCQTWKTRPNDFKLPVKYGLYENGYITPSNADDWRLTAPMDGPTAIAYMRSVPLTTALWWFIENVGDNNDYRSECFFYLRERVRAESTL